MKRLYYSEKCFYYFETFDAAIRWWFVNEVIKPEKCFKHFFHGLLAMQNVLKIKFSALFIDQITNQN